MCSRQEVKKPSNEKIAKSCILDMCTWWECSHLKKNTIVRGGGGGLVSHLSKGFVLKKTFEKLTLPEGLEK